MFYTPTRLSILLLYLCLSFFFLNDTSTTEIYTYGHTLSLHDALPICIVLSTSTNGTSAITAPHRSGSELTTAPINSPPADRPAIAIRPLAVHPPAISPLATSMKSVKVLVRFSSLPS